LEIFDAKSRVWGQFGSENKLIEGQPNEYDVICRNASVYAFHLWPTNLPERRSGSKIFGVPQRSRTTTPLVCQRRNAAVPWLVGVDCVVERRAATPVTRVHQCAGRQQVPDHVIVVRQLARHVQHRHAVTVL